MSYNSIKTFSALGKTQTDGAVELDTSGSLAIPENMHRSPRNLALKDWQIQLEISDAGGDPAVPAKGTLAVAAKSPDGTRAVQIGTIDMTAGDQIYVVEDPITAEAFEVTPVGFDADKFYTIILGAS